MKPAHLRSRRRARSEGRDRRSALFPLLRRVSGIGLMECLGKVVGHWRPPLWLDYHPARRFLDDEVDVVQLLVGFGEVGTGMRTAALLSFQRRTEQSFRIDEHRIKVACRVPAGIEGERPRSSCPAHDGALSQLENLL